MNKYSKYINNPDYEFIKYEDGGETTGRINIEIEGSGSKEGSMSAMNKGELLVKDGQIIEDYASANPHAKGGKQVLAQPGAIVIDKKHSEEYKGRSVADRKILEAMIVSKQMKRQRKEDEAIGAGVEETMATMAKGGIYYKESYGKGGVIHVKPRFRKAVSKAAKTALIPEPDFLETVAGMAMMQGAMMPGGGLDPDYEMGDGGCVGYGCGGKVYGKGGYVPGQMYDVSEEELEQLKRAGYKFRMA